MLLWTNPEYPTFTIGKCIVVSCCIPQLGTAGDDAWWTWLYAGFGWFRLVGPSESLKRWNAAKRLEFKHWINGSWKLKKYCIHYFNLFHMNVGKLSKIQLDVQHVFFRWEKTIKNCEQQLVTGGARLYVFVRPWPRCKMLGRSVLWWSNARLQWSCDAWVHL